MSSSLWKMYMLTFIKGVDLNQPVHLHSSLLTYEPNYEEKRISLSMPRRLVQTDIFFASCGFTVSGIITLYLYPLRRNVSTRINMCGLRMLIWIDTLRSVHNVGFSWNG